MIKPQQIREHLETLYANSKPLDPADPKQTGDYLKAAWRAAIEAELEAVLALTPETVKGAKVGPLQVFIPRASAPEGTDVTDLVVAGAAVAEEYRREGFITRAVAPGAEFTEPTVEIAW
jgi:hypothetical protein